MSRGRGELVSAARERSSRPVGTDPLEYATRAAAETLLLLEAAVAADPGAHRGAAVREAVASARATTEAAKFALVALTGPDGSAGPARPIAS